MTRQETIEKAVNWALATARDASHGYDQARRWGPDYDCSSFVISAWEAAGVPVKAKGASYTGDMFPAFLACGFRDVTGNVNLRTGAGLVKGDVLLNAAHHTELCIGGGQTVKASLNERGGVTGGQTGDQSGREICVGSYYEPSYGWGNVLRYEGGEDDTSSGADAPPSHQGEGLALPVLSRGDKGISVLAMQAVLIARGFKCGWWGADGDFGSATEDALKGFQKHCEIEADGICGPETWAYLLGVRT
jgi:hypothetical protein